jgi:hypothetical protein
MPSIPDLRSADAFLTLSGSQKLEGTIIFADDPAKFIEPLGSVAREDAADRDTVDQPSQDRELPGAEVSIEDLVCESVGYEREQSILGLHSLQSWRRICPPLAQEINGAERKRTALEPRTVLS